MAESIQWPLLSTEAGVPNTFPGDWNACVRTDRDHPPNPYTIPSPSPAPEVMVTNGKFSAIISSYAFTYYLAIDTVLYTQETGRYPAKVVTHQVPRRSIVLIDVSPQSPRLVRQTKTRKSCKRNARTGSSTATRRGTMGTYKVDRRRRAWKKMVEEVHRPVQDMTEDAGAGPSSIGNCDLTFQRQDYLQPNDTFTGNIYLSDDSTSDTTSPGGQSGRLAHAEQTNTIEDTHEHLVSNFLLCSSLPSIIMFIRR
jgi:hypothetical protein